MLSTMKKNKELAHIKWRCMTGPLASIFQTTLYNKREAGFIVPILYIGKLKAESERELAASTWHLSLSPEVSK